MSIANLKEGNTNNGYGTTSVESENNSSSHTNLRTLLDQERGQVNLAYVNEDNDFGVQVQRTNGGLGGTDNNGKESNKNRKIHEVLERFSFNGTKKSLAVEKDPLKPIIYTQILGALAACSSYLCIGTLLGLPAVTLPQLTDHDSGEIILNTQQVALYSSIVHIGAMFGSIVSGPLNHRLGQRMTLLITLPLTLCSWIGLAFSPFVWMILVIRFIQGSAQGFIGVASGNYAVEIAHSSIRGKLGGANDTYRQLGILLVYVIGSFNLSWRQVSVLSGLVSTIPPFLGLCLLPNSPRWLITQGRIEEAEKSLTFYRGSSYDVKGELSSIMEQFEQITSQFEMTKQLKEMGSKNIYPRIIFLTYLMIAINFTGNIAIAAFIVPIFQAASEHSDPYSSAIVIGSLRVVGIIVFLIVVDKFGRKTIFVFSGIICSCCLIALGGFFFMQNRGTDVSSISWLPLGSLVIYSPFAVSMQAISSLLRSELLPTSLRAMGVSLMFVVFFLSMFASTQIFPYLMEFIGEEGAFWLFAGSTIFLVLVAGIAMPETKGLSLEEIESRCKPNGSHCESLEKEKTKF